MFGEGCVGKCCQIRKRHSVKCGFQINNNFFFFYKYVPNIVFLSGHSVPLFANSTTIVGKVEHRVLRKIYLKRRLSDRGGYYVMLRSFGLYCKGETKCFEQANDMIRCII